MNQWLKAWYHRWQVKHARWEVWAYAPGFGMKLQTLKTRQAAIEFKRSIERPGIREKFPGDYIAIVPRFPFTKTWSETL